MIFNSTRDKDLKANSLEAILQGLAPDGGLFIPKNFPSFKPMEDLLDYSYQDLASYIIGSYFDEFSKEEMDEIVAKAYGDTFGDKIIDLKAFDDLAFIELFHGPTQAFKDMALSILPHLMVKAGQKLGQKEDIAILAATSGDTGKAALEGFKDVDGTRVIVFYPKDGVSHIQYLQMASQEGTNLDVIAIKGNFDQAQTGVKKIFMDPKIRDQVSQAGYRFSSANSINIGRLVPQIVYYVYSYLDLAKKGKIKINDRVNIVVPTGNFGNILAAVYAYVSGLPVNKFILASNDNKVLVDFFTTGKYDKNRDLILTSSPSMDILVSSNLERFLYHIAEEDTVQVNNAMDKLDRDGVYRWFLLLDNFYANYATEEDISKAIKKLDQDREYIIDPHTAVAYSTHLKYLEDQEDGTYTMIASTASPYKFPTKVLDSLNIERQEDKMKDLYKLEDHSGIKIPESLAKLEDEKKIHDKTIEVDQMADTVIHILTGRDED